MKHIPRGIAWTLAWLVILTGLAIVLVPPFLDRRYYRGVTTTHYDGERFANPDGDDDTLRLPSGGSRIGFFWRYLTGSDGRPPWPEHVAIRPAPLPLARVDGQAMVVTWIGHATVLVQTQGLNILTDPVWSDHAGPFGFGPARVAPAAVPLDRLPKIDLILVSHDHYDHMDLLTLRRLWDRDRPLIVTSLGNDSVMAGAGVPAYALDWGGRVALPSCPPPVGPHPGHWPGPRCTTPPFGEVIVTRNHHWGSRWFSDRDRALWSSFVVRLPGGNLFFAGDTGMGDGRWPAEAAAYGPIRLALIPIGAFRFTPGQMAIGSHIGPVDAVEVYRRLRAAHAVGIHWGTFRLSYEAYDTPPRLLRAAMRCTGQTGFGIVRLGTPMVVPAYVAPAPVAPLGRAELLACLDTPQVRALR